MRVKWSFKPGPEFQIVSVQALALRRDETRPKETLMRFKIRVSHKKSGRAKRVDAAQDESKKNQ